MRKELRWSIQRGARELLSSGRETWPDALASADAEHRCGARCKQGSHSCPRRPEPGMKRCRVHGIARPRFNGRWATQAESEGRPRQARVFAFARIMRKWSMRKDLRQSIQRRARELLYSGQEPDWMSALARSDREHTCGARCKQTGRPCQVRPEPGKRRCYLHGGRTPPSTEAQKRRQSEVSKTWPRGATGTWRSATAQEASI